MSDFKMNNVFPLERVHEGYHTVVDAVILKRFGECGKRLAVKHGHIATLSRKYVPVYHKVGVKTITVLEKFEIEQELLKMAQKIPGVVRLREDIRSIVHGRQCLWMAWSGVPLMIWKDTRYIASLPMLKCERICTCMKCHVTQPVLCNLDAPITLKDEDMADPLVRTVYTESEARLIMTQLIQIVHDVHDLGIIMKDIKPDNILIRKVMTHRTRETLDQTIKVFLCDFSSAVLATDGLIFDSQGTPHFSPPELFRYDDEDDEQVILDTGRRSFDGKKRDNWSIGMTLYVMLTGRFPFDTSRTGLGLELSIADLHTVQSPSDVSTECKVVIDGLLSTQPKSRWDLKRVMHSQWLSGASLSPVLSEQI